ncbi:2-amino-4-hydroxy-6-hydroxymethyldihydropteridine diphosphokinase [Moraxella canis]|uniref:2-amino-4-hydroxy-6-hydroxymethyldihydropteridine pyrophosphokinase n=1 Tax=Moraxella canis TaxID=90239 RepID=A0A1S9ZKF2_9GAMM|nr:2-amino-4-hydroxy-6-hydroxymethyldihydropteridine diphosphokinase [Moraxella canis]OOR83833.1 2-amino-4-hydroxy-6-hydroxymethyldihydropteridine diphosphokinase [Moraxella canis]
MISCYIGLGANISNALGTPIEHIERAVAAFKASSAFYEVRTSSLYRSAAFGVTDQPDFYNAVLSAKTTLLPIALLDFCQSLESDAGRIRKRHWGERSLDVDVLLYGDEMINTDRLTVPHPGLFERNFVLVPLLELEDVHIQGTPISQSPVAHDMTGLELLDHWA